MHSPPFPLSHFPSYPPDSESPHVIKLLVCRTYDLSRLGSPVHIIYRAAWSQVEMEAEVKDASAARNATRPTRSKSISTLVTGLFSTFEPDANLIVRDIYELVSHVLLYKG